jgi:hypothetical protein
VFHFEQGDFLKSREIFREVKEKIKPHLDISRKNSNASLYFRILQAEGLLSILLMDFNAFFSACDDLRALDSTLPMVSLGRKLEIKKLFSLEKQLKKSKEGF